MALDQMISISREPSRGEARRGEASLALGRRCKPQIECDGGRMILLTGATGRVGSAAANTLLQAGVPFRVLVRDPGKFTLAHSSIQVVAGDLGDDVAVAGALKGVDRALIVMGNHPDQAGLERRFVDLAAGAGDRKSVV